MRNTKVLVGFVDQILNQSQPASQVQHSSLNGKMPQLLEWVAHPISNKLANTTLKTEMSVTL